MASIYIDSWKISIQRTNSTFYLVHQSVAVLDASYNQISNIQFEINSRLTELNLSNNNLSSMKNITHLHGLQHLDLSFNSIKDFGIFSFLEMNDLHVLNLRKSGSTHVRFGMFSVQEKLIFLDLSDNNLKEINFDKLFIPMLSVLHIGGNQLTNIDDFSLESNLPNLTAIDISRNHFACKDLVKIVRFLSLLHIDLHSDDWVKNSSNVAGVNCFEDSHQEKQITNNFTSLDLHRQAQNFDSRESFESLKQQFDKRFNELVHNVTDLHEQIRKQNLLNCNNESDLFDSFRFQLAFLLIVVILFTFGLSLLLYWKICNRRRWYTTVKQNATSADQTLV